MPRTEPLCRYGHVAVWPGAKHGYDIATAVNQLTSDFVRDLQDGIKYANQRNLEEARKKVERLRELNRTLRYIGVAEVGREIIKTAERKGSPVHFDVD